MRLKGRSSQWLTLSLDLQADDRRVSGWVAKAELRKTVGNRTRDQQIAHVLVVGGNDVPGRCFGARLRENPVVRLREVIPSRAIIEVAGAKFPILLGVAEPLDEPPLLLVTRDVQQEFQNDHVVRR